MCGISGFISKNGVFSKEILAMNKKIIHRGPDDEGFLLLETSGILKNYGSLDTDEDVWQLKTKYKPTFKIEEETTKAILGLGHRRLSILDLSAHGHMPMCDEMGLYWIVYNGEVYNYVEIREQLKVLGYSFSTNTDTEVLLKSYQQWGEKCLDRFVGMFSFCIYDVKAKVVFLVRDRHGIKPLYYWISKKGDLYFSSEIKQFTACEGWISVLNHQRAFDYLQFSLTDHTNETMFKGVFQIPPGHSCLISLENISFQENVPLKTKLWYNPKQTDFKGTVEEAIAKFKLLFIDSVALHLRADVKVGSALSGGLDSSSVVCVVNQLLRDKSKENLQNTFSSVSVDEKYSEKKWVDSLLQTINVESHFIYPNFQDLYPLTEKILWHMDEPYQSQSVFLGYHVFQKAHETNTKVLLNGQGADEYLSGYSDFRILRQKKMVLHFKWVKLYKEIQSAGGNFTSFIKLLKSTASDIIPDKHRLFFVERTKSYKRLSNNFDFSILNITKKHPFALLKRDRFNMQSISNHQLLSDPLPKYLRWEDRNSMAFSVEARVPFLDHRLIEFCHSLPLNYLDTKENSKNVLVEAMKGILPENIRKRKDKKGFITPEQRWLQIDSPEFFRKKIKELLPYGKGIINENAICYFEKMIDSKIPFDYSYWRLLLFCQWMKTFNIVLDSKKINE